MSTSGIQSLIDPSNALFEAARTGKRLPNIVVATLILIAVMAVGFAITGIAGRLIYGDTGDTAPLMEGYYGYIIPFALIIGALWVWVRVYERRRFASIGLGAGGALFKYAVGLAVGFGMVAVTVGLMCISGGVALEPAGDVVTGVAAVGGSLLVLMGFGVQGASEEIITRGWYMPVLGVRYRPITGVIVSTVLFAGLHAPTQPVYIVNLLLFGLFLALYALREGTIWGICGWHTAWNWSMGNVFGLKISGHDPFGDTIINLQATGHPLLSGGEFGPEGSLWATLVLATGIVTVILSARKRDRVSPV
ncbi:MAG: CPBP family intramembrane metalloprotease [Candidatus Zixiibacteriota bacterium]|nr:MAG: CPBP family intramembrane metalloprotease [candidate division Zixibacteria bacterium]